MSKEIRSAIILPDMQVPYEDERTLKAVESFISKYKWDYYLQLGDFLDLDCISSFSRNYPEKLLNKQLSKDFDRGNEILDRHQKLILKNNKKTKFVMLEGNHEFRVEKWISEFPQLRGLMDVEKNLKLDERGFKYVRCYRDG